MKNIKTFPAALLMLAFAAGLAACTGGGGSPGPSAPPSGTAGAVSQTEEGPEKELYRVDVFTMLGNYSGVQTGWFAKLVKDRFNMELNLISSNVDGGGDVKFAARMASGNLGDIVIYGNEDSKYLDSISGGFLLDMTKNGLLDEYGKYIIENYPRLIQKAKVHFGGGTAVYGFGYNVADMPDGPSEGEDMSWGPNLRWDLYERLGRPEINTLEDYLPVLKKMQELEPRSDSGKPTYGFSLWADWDGDKLCLAKQYANVHGYDETDGFNPIGIALISADEEKYQELLEPESYYIKCLKLYFNANRLGLMDPDSISQKYEDVVSKYKDGQVLFSWFPWMDSIYNTRERQEQGKGFMLVPFKEERVYSIGFNPYGDNRLISIGARAKHPERLMEFINWMYTPEGVIMSCAVPYVLGPQGLTWDMKDGRPVLTEFGKKALPNNPVSVPAQYGGGTFKDGVNQMNFNTVQPTSINPETNEPYDYHLWSSYVESNSTRLIENWRAAMGVSTAKEYFVSNDLIAVREPIFTGKAPNIMDIKLEQKKGQVAAVIRQYSWKMVFAGDEAEFEALQKEMTAKARSLGYDEVVKWYVAQARQVFEYRKGQQAGD